MKLAAIKNPNAYAMATLTDQEEVAFLFRKYALVEAPVVDDSGKLAGTITVDDVVDVIEEEGEEDYLRTSGITESDFRFGVLATVRLRFGWLFINLLTAVLDVWVVGLFQHSIEKLVELAVVMPMVASMSGNTGTQTEAVAIRSIATKFLTTANRWKYVRKEATIGFCNGAGIGIIMAIGAYFWFHEPLLSVVLFMSATICMTLAGLFAR
ncbi:MAG: magnesium transporter [Alphaproteobacteria bacterium]